MYKYNLSIENKKKREYQIDELLPKQVKEFTPLIRDEIYAR
jgi:hypothetical protein